MNIECHCDEPLISLNGLSIIFSPQNLKLNGYIKNQKVIVFIPSGNNHNFIHRRVSKETHCYVHVVHNYKIMIVNGGMVKCGGEHKNLKLQMGDYWLKCHMFTIEMGGCGVVLSD